jgi:hypothetical protein
VQLLSCRCCLQQLPVNACRHGTQHLSLNNCRLGAESTSSCSDVDLSYMLLTQLLLVLFSLLMLLML